MEPNERLLKVIHEVFGVAPSEITLQTDTDSIDGWDSLGHLNLIMAIEKEFGIKFPAKKIILLDSVEKIQNALVSMGAI